MNNFDWFNLDTYKQADKFDALEWAHFLSDRAYKLDIINNGNKTHQMILEQFNDLKEGKLTRYMQACSHYHPIEGIESKNCKPHHTLLKINIHAPKIELMKQFEHFVDLVKVKGGKNKTANTKVFNSGESKRLVKYRILPLLDFEIYTLLTGQKISDETLIEYLYDPFSKIDNADRLKEDKKLKNKFISDNYIDWLLSHQINLP